MKTKNFVCLFAILVANNGLANNTNFDLQKEYSKCMRSESCKKRHNPNTWTNWDNIIEYMQITDQNLEKLKTEKKQKEEQKKEKEEEDLKKEAEKMRREQDEYIKRLKKWYGRLKL